MFRQSFANFAKVSGKYFGGLVACSAVIKE
jgi:hypothetical protein